MISGPTPQSNLQDYYLPMENKISINITLDPDGKNSRTYQVRVEPNLTVLELRNKLKEELQLEDSFSLYDDQENLLESFNRLIDEGIQDGENITLRRKIDEKTEIHKRHRQINGFIELSTRQFPFIDFIENPQQPASHKYKPGLSLEGWCGSCQDTRVVSVELSNTNSTQVLEMKKVCKEAKCTEHPQVTLDVIKCIFSNCSYSIQGKKVKEDEEKEDGVGFSRQGQVGKGWVSFGTAGGTKIKWKSLNITVLKENEGWLTKAKDYPFVIALLATASLIVYYYANSKRR